MPLYEYRCKQCHRLTEKIQKFSDPELTTCPHCAGSLERTLTAPAIQFKGSGWYKDLYSSAKPAAPPGEGAGGHAEGGGDASAPAGSAPAESASTKSEPTPSAASASAPAPAPSTSSSSSPASGN